MNMKKKGNKSLYVKSNQTRNRKEKSNNDETVENTETPF